MAGITPTYTAPPAKTGSFLNQTGAGTAPPSYANLPSGQPANATPNSSVSLPNISSSQPVPSGFINTGSTSSGEITIVGTTSYPTIQAPNLTGGGIRPIVGGGQIVSNSTNTVSTIPLTNMTGGGIPTSTTSQEVLPSTPINIGGGQTITIAGQNPTAPSSIPAAPLGIFGGGTIYDTGLSGDIQTYEREHGTAPIFASGITANLNIGGSTSPQSLAIAQEAEIPIAPNDNKRQVLKLYS